MTVRLLILGGGKMGEALAQGLLVGGWCSVDELAITEKLEARRSELVGRFPGVDVRAEATTAEGAILATRPEDLESACRSIPSIDRVLSIAAGVTLGQLERWLPARTRIVRSMPNLAATVAASATAIAPGPNAGEDDLAWAEGILQTVGVVVRVPESLMDAVTGLSASGPAYVFLVLEAMVEAGVLAGLPRVVSQTLSLQTLMGAGQLVLQTGQLPEVLRSKVTTPGGTTAAGLRVLEQRGVRAAFLDAVEAAAARAKELGQA